MKGYEYCRQHQPTCAYKLPNGKTCRNFVVEQSAFCAFHLPSGESDEKTSSPEQTSFLEPKQTGFLEDDYTRREFITFRWPLRAVRKIASSVTSLSGPIKIVGSIVAAGVAEYLISDFLDYFKQVHNIEFFFAPASKDIIKSEGMPAWDNGAGKAVPGATKILKAIPRIINRGTRKASLTARLVNYDSGRVFSTPAITISPNHSYVGLFEDGQVPNGFGGGVEISSDQPLEACAIIELKITDNRLNPYESQFLEFVFPHYYSNQLDIQNLTAMMAVGREEEMQHVSDVQCTVRENRIYFDRETILDIAETTGATDGLFFIQLEGQIILTQEIRDNFRKYFPEASGGESQVTTRFETTAEVVPVVM